MTPKQSQALNFIEKFWAEKDFGPSYQDLATGLKCSKNNAFTIVERLCEHGYIKKTPHKHHAIKSLRPKKPETPPAVPN